MSLAYINLPINKRKNGVSWLKANSAFPSGDECERFPRHIAQFPGAPTGALFGSSTGPPLRHKPGWPGETEFCRSN